MSHKKVLGFSLWRCSAVTYPNKPISYMLLNSDLEVQYVLQCPGLRLFRPNRPSDVPLLPYQQTSLHALTSTRGPGGTLHTSADAVPRESQRRDNPDSRDLEPAGCTIRPVSHVAPTRASPHTRRLPMSAWPLKSTYSNDPVRSPLFPDVVSVGTRLILPDWR
jgi:hypothetical protein